MAAPIGEGTMKQMTVTLWLVVLASESVFVFPHKELSYGRRQQVHTNICQPLPHSFKDTWSFNISQLRYELN